MGASQICHLLPFILVGALFPFWWTFHSYWLISGKHELIPVIHRIGDPDYFPNVIFKVNLMELLQYGAINCTLFMLNLTIHTIVIDNDDSREHLIHMIRENCPAVEIVSECNSIKSAYHSIRQYLPRLVFLATDLEDGNGFEVLKMCRDIHFKTILVSPSTEYAVEAYRFSVADFLLKPVNPEELMEAVRKVQSSGDMESETGDEKAGKAAMNNHMIIANTKGFTVVKNDEIILCEASGYCTVFYLSGNRKISSSHNLKHYTGLLPENRFMRVHNSFIINLEHVKGYTYQGEILLSENLKCSLSAGKKRMFLAAFGKMK
jgi:two-component system, LytTR family, response regulator